MLIKKRTLGILQVGIFTIYIAVILFVNVWLNNRNISNVSISTKLLTATRNPDFTKVADAQECTGKEIIKHAATLDDCAKSCEGLSSMFAYGTNDYGKTRCYKNGTCTCLCETIADRNGTCTQFSHNGYRLYRYVEKGKLKRPNAYIKDTFLRHVNSTRGDNVQNWLMF